MTTTPNVHQAVPLFWVRDIQASLRFYRDGLGFAVTKEWVDEGRLRWCWLTRDGVAVMLQESGTDGAQGTVAEGPVGRGVIVHFICGDALAAYRDFRSRGIEAKRPFVGNAMWVTELADPDGYRLVFESPTDATEDSEYPG
jgi:lactoylglutathione lyase